LLNKEGHHWYIIYRFSTDRTTIPTIVRDWG